MPRPRPQPSRPYLFAGLVSGVVAAALAIVASLALQDLTGDHYDQLSPAGGAISWLLARRMARPARWFGVLAMAAAAIDTQFVFVSPPAHGFAAVAVPVHYIVALVAAVVIPTVGAGRLPFGPKAPGAVC